MLMASCCALVMQPNQASTYSKLSQASTRRFCTFGKLRGLLLLLAAADWCIAGHVWVPSAFGKSRVFDYVGILEGRPGLTGCNSLRYTEEKPHSIDFCHVDWLTTPFHVTKKYPSAIRIGFLSDFRLPKHRSILIEFILASRLMPHGQCCINYKLIN